jgi:hypothetical protein
MLTRVSLEKMKKNIFWDGFFFVFGFNSNPLSAELKELADKSIDQRIGESWQRTSDVFKETFEKEEFHHK